MLTAGRSSEGATLMETACFFALGLGLDHFFHVLAAGKIEQRLADQAVAHEKFFLQAVLVGGADGEEFDLGLADAVGQEGELEQAVAARVQGALDLGGAADARSPAAWPAG